MENRKKGLKKINSQPKGNSGSTMECIPALQRKWIFIERNIIYPVDYTPPEKNHSCPDKYIDYIGSITSFLVYKQMNITSTLLVNSNE